MKKKMDPDQHQCDADRNHTFLAGNIVMVTPLQFHIFRQAIGKGRVLFIEQLTKK
jgi:hypothetical protein